MIKLLNLRLLIFLSVAFFVNISSFAQDGLQIEQLNTPKVITFDEALPGVMPAQYQGTGLDSVPNPGQLNSNAFAVTGLSDGNSLFGENNAVGDFARGDSSNPVETGGLYAFLVEANNYAFGIQPAGSDFTPGTLTLKVQNQTGEAVNVFDLSYIIWVRNDQDRANSLNVKYSIDNSSFISLNEFDFVSPEAADSPSAWASTPKSQNQIITSQSIPNDGFLYIQFESNDVSGLGPRDELAIDDISISLGVFQESFVVDFDEDTKWTAGSGGIDSYQSDHYYEDLDWLFTGGPALRQTTSGQDGFSGALDMYAWRLKNETGVEWTASYQGSEVITAFGFEVRRWAADPNLGYSIEYSFDGGASFVNTGDVIDNNFLNDSSDWATYNFELPSIQHHDTGDFVVRLIRNGGERIMIDNFSFVIATEDKDTQVLSPDNQVVGEDIIVGEATGTDNAKPVFRFKIQDSGSQDGLPTLVNNFRLIAGSSNSVNFSEVIDNVVVKVDGDRIFNDGTDIELLDDEILISFDHDYTSGNGGGQPNNLLDITDGNTANIEIAVSLKQQSMVSGGTLQLAIDDNSSIGFGVEQESSIFAKSFNPSVTGNPFQVVVNATKLSFIKQPQYAKVNTPMPFGVVVAATDEEGNIDQSFDGAIQLTSSGTLTNSPLESMAIDGIATFEVIEHTETGEDLTLTALSAPLPDNTSLKFNIGNPIELFISEVTDPSQDFEARYIEIFNHGVDSIDLDNEEIYLTVQFNAGSRYDSAKLEGKLAPKSYYIVGKPDFESIYGFAPNLEQTSNPVANGNGDDAYFLSFGGDPNSNENEMVRNYFDIYGEHFEQANNTDPWFYEDKIAYRKNPPTIEETQVWEQSQWEIISGELDNTTPGYGNQDYIYVDDESGWTEIGLGSQGNNYTASNENTNIEIRGGQVVFDTPILVNDLVVRAGATLIIEDAVTVKGDIVNLGEVIFKSDEVKTAVLGEASERTRVRGEFIIERYIPNSSRAFRYLSSSVTTSTSIRDNWQEGVNNTEAAGEGEEITGNNNPNPGYGTHITGSTIGENGFDATQTGHPSMFYWDITSNPHGWNEIDNTDNLTLSAGTPYAILIRGDRSTPLNSNVAVGPATTLRTKGSLVIGTKSVADLSEVVDGFSFIGNPYQAKVDLFELLENSSGINTQFVYIYDPTLGNQGGYATVDLSDGSPPTTTPATSGANQFLEPNQAFFIKTESAGGSEVIFEESYKTTETDNNSTFSTTEEQTNLHVNLFYQDETTKPVDAVKVKFRPGASNANDRFDATKLWNYKEAFAIHRSSAYMAIETRAMPTQQDSIPFYFGNFSRDTYRLEIKPEHLTSSQAYLYDNYLETKVELPSDETTAYVLEIDNSIPASKATDRFVIKFENETLSNEDFDANTSFAVHPNPVKGEHITISHKQDFDGEMISLQLFDMQGRLVMDREIDNAPRVNVGLGTNLASGVYVLKLTDNFNTQSVKLIVD